jgi:hypothetical protein
MEDTMAAAAAMATRISMDPQMKSASDATGSAHFSLGQSGFL